MSSVKHGNCGNTAKVVTDNGGQCPTLDLGCIYQDKGSPIENNIEAPAKDKLPFYIDTTTKELWFYSCDDGWIKANKRVCDLAPVDLENLNNVCETLKIPVTYSMGGQCVEGTLTLQEFAIELIKCIELPNPLSCVPLTIGKPNSAPNGDSGIKYDPCTQLIWYYICDEDMWVTSQLSIEGLSEINPDNLTNICENLKFYTWYDDGECTRIHEINLANLAEQIEKCLGCKVHYQARSIVVGGGVCVQISKENMLAGDVAIFQARNGALDLSETSGNVEVLGTGDLEFYVEDTYTNTSSCSVAVKYTLHGLAEGSSGQYVTNGDLKETFVHNIGETLAINMPSRIGGNGLSTSESSAVTLHEGVATYAAEENVPPVLVRTRVATQAPMTYTKVLQPGESITIYGQWWLVLNALTDLTTGSEAIVYHGTMELEREVFFGAIN